MTCLLKSFESFYCALAIYLLKSGCQWRMLPSDFPKWHTVHHYFSLWSKQPEDGHSLLEQALKNQVGAARTRQGRSVKTSFCIVDAQSVRNADCAKHKGHDAGKKVYGIKRNIQVDTQGLLHAIAVTTADVTDRQGALKAIGQHAGNLSAVSVVLADGGYTGQPCADSVTTLIRATVQSSNALNCTLFQSFPNAGWSKGHSPGWKSVEDFGKILKCPV